MKVAIYSPYLDTLGGGERYMATIAEIFSHKNEVCILLDEHLNSLGPQKLITNLSKRFNLNLQNVKPVKAPIGKNSNFLSRIFFLMGYDLFFYLTDGSIFYPTAKRNILHIQTPLLGEPSKSFFGKIKLKNWNLIIYNSKFTQTHAKNNWPLKSEVVYPPVDVDKIRPLKKMQFILSVGRFFGYLKDKKHELLIDTFKKFYRNKTLKDWSLHLVGSASEGDKPYIEELKKIANNFPVKFYPNLEYDKLVNLYGQSSIYWHASGYEEDDSTKMEHFGISTVEAMAGGCVPVVIGKGGQVEIIEHEKSGFLWHTVDEMERFTLRLVENSDILEKMSDEAKKRSKIFSKERFTKDILNIA